MKKIFTNLEIIWKKSRTKKCDLSFLSYFQIVVYKSSENQIDLKSKKQNYGCSGWEGGISSPKRKILKKSNCGI